jgi:glycosyltransferase involved in cell wall biosynthesis
MRILQVSSAEGIGGGEGHLADLARSLAARGVEVHVAVRATSEIPRLMGGGGPEVVWHRVPLRNALDIKSVRALARIVEEHQIDVVHAHVARDYPVAAIACRRGPTPLVLTRHHYLPIKGNILYRRLLARAIVIAVSESVRATVLESLRLPPERVVTIPNWIDLERYDEPRDRAAERHARGIARRVAVGLVGQITPLKGHEEFVRAAALVARERPDVEFLIFGEDRDLGAPFERRLRTLVRDLGLEGAVRFMGYEPDLPGALAALDAVAAPSWNEAFSLVTAEAMAAGRPVVASRAGALEELISDGETGLLVPPRDPAALARAISRVASDPALSERLGRAARASAGRFAREPRVDQVLEVYRRALAREPA